MALYRPLTGLVVLLVLALAFLPEHDQQRLQMPDPWSYEAATAQFAASKWVLNDEEMAAIRTQARFLNAPTPQYIHLGPDAWAFRQAAGHPLEMVAAQWLWHPRLANALLAVLAALALYPLLAAWHSERLACLGVTLLLFSPLSLTALHYYNMDTFAGGMWPLIGGALLLWYGAKGREGRFMPLLLLAAGWALGWAVVVRITNGLLLLFCGLYLLGLLWPRRAAAPSRKRGKGKSRQRAREEGSGWDRTRLLHLGAFALGCLPTLLIMALYNRATFGSVWDSGYFYSSPDDQFYLWNENAATSVPGGVPTWLAGGTVWHIILTLLMHLWLWLRPATFAWPLWPLALYGFLWLLRKQRPLQPTTWFMFGWLLLVYAPYAGVAFFGVTRALAVPSNQTWHFFVVARYLFPISFALILLVSQVLQRQSRRVAFAFVAVYAVGCASLYLYALRR